ncbi:MAG: hypothetical protein J3R72DRAFT_102462 [Linnemannia gamsii]|nr:MAG: hypothetical protein J3R72DRAFT_102462 [Linnemannia gamsii]
MLAPQDSPISDTLVHPRSISRAPQDPNYNIDDSSRASTLIVSSPQYIDGYSAPPSYTADSPYRTQSVRHPQTQSVEHSPSVNHPQAQSVEYSPSVNHPHAYSPNLASPRVSLSYIPPPSPTPSQSNTYPVPEGHLGKIAYLTDEGAYHHQQYQNIFQEDPYQHSYQQPYPEPALHAFPEPALVDSFDEKIVPTSGTKPGNGRRKKIIWIGVFVILALIGVIVALVITMKNKDSGSNDNFGNNLGNNTARTSSTLRPTTSATRTSIPVGTPTSSTPVTIPTSSLPVIIPIPQPSSGSGGSSGGGGRVTAPPLPPLPTQGQCPFSFCGDYYRNCRFKVCNQDSEYQECMNKCGGEAFCGMDCLTSTSCQNTCESNTVKCDAHCR